MEIYCINLYIDLDNYIENFRIIINEVFNQLDFNVIMMLLVLYVYIQRNIVNIDIFFLFDND